MSGKSKGPTLVPLAVQREFADHRGPAHCLHVAGEGFPIVAPAPGRPGIFGVIKTCCWCGPLRIEYLGVLEQGHGPWVTYQPEVQINVRPNIVLPG